MGGMGWGEGAGWGDGRGGGEGGEGEGGGFWGRLQQRLFSRRVFLLSTNASIYILLSSLDVWWSVRRIASGLYLFHLSLDIWCFPVCIPGFLMLTICRGCTSFWLDHFLFQQDGFL